MSSKISAREWNRIARSQLNARIAEYRERKCMARSQRDAHIAADARNGVPRPAIAAKYGLSDGQVSRICLAAGIRMYSRQRNAQIAEEARNGSARSEIAAVGIRRPPRPYPETQRNALILAKRDEGMTLAAIGAAFGISRERVRKIAGTGTGAAARDRIKRARSERNAAIAEEDRNGIHRRTIAVRYYLSWPAVSRICEAAGNPRPRPRNKGHYPHAGRDAIILAKRAEGLSLAAIGAEFGITAARVCTIIARNLKMEEPK
jgi:DNA-binding CsgD family transcriptional regulator